MTEKERMLAGKYYKHIGDELRSMSHKSRKLVHEFNKSDWDESDKRKQIIKELFGSVGENFSILQTINCCYGANIFIGNNFFSNYDCIFLDVNRITVGNNVRFGPRVNLYTAAHPIDKTARNENYEYGLPITIGNDVWIGGGVIILPGVTIGNNVVIGAGSVVTKNIPDNVVATGNPCKVIRAISVNDRDTSIKMINEYKEDIKTD